MKSIHHKISFYGRLHVIAYCATRDLPREVVWSVARPLAAEQYSAKEAVLWPPTGPYSSAADKVVNRWHCGTLAMPSRLSPALNSASRDGHCEKPIAESELSLRTRTQRGIPSGS